MSGEPMKIGVVGLGSMGKRRVRDLLDLGADVVGFDVRDDRCTQGRDMFGIATRESFAGLLAERPRAIVISTPPDVHARYYELTVFRVRLGHEKQWRDVTRMYKDACEKAGLNIHWGMYETAYGGEGGTYIGLTHRDSLAEIDQERANGKKFVEALGGEEAAAKLDQIG